MATEKVNVQFTESRANIYRVPEKQWRRWGITARQVFNDVLSSMVKNQSLFLHPDQPKASKSHWRTTAWNAAWTAASAVAKIVP